MNDINSIIIEGKVKSFTTKDDCIYNDMVIITSRTDKDRTGNIVVTETKVPVKVRKTLSLSMGSVKGVRIVGRLAKAGSSNRSSLCIIAEHVEIKK